MATAYGVEVEDLPDGWQPVDVLVIAKCIDTANEDDSPYRLFTKISSGIPVWEVAGMLRCVEADAVAQFVEDNDAGD